jgi:DNA-binding transcriptional MocR family regulator
MFYTSLMVIHYRKKQNTLYRKIADDIELMIIRGLYEEGKRIPSIRQMSENLQVSINTVKEAYALLETRQFIEGRPNSGYYVNNISARDFPHLKSEDYYEPVTRDIPENLIYQKILKEVLNPDHVPLGAAVASPSILPLQDFNALISSLSEEQRRICLSYAPIEGIKELRIAIARKLMDSGLSLSHNDIVITAGCVEGIYLALSVLTNPGDTIAIQSPIYFNLFPMFRNLGLKIMEIPSDPVTGISLDVLHYAIRQKEIKACIIISNYNNPSGSTIPDNHKEKLVEMLRNAEIPLLDDDIYGDLSFTGQRPKSCLSFDSSGNTLLFSSFSKTVSPGLRIGFIIPGKYKDEILQQKMAMNVSTSSITQLLLANYLNSGGFYRHMRKLCRELAMRMELLRTHVGEYFPKGTRMSDPKGGVSLWIELPASVSGLDLFNRSIQEGISIVPGEIFSQEESFRNYIRLDSGCYSEDLKWSIEKLGSFVNELLFLQ